LALKRYGFGKGEGLYTDMNAVRPDEILDNLHSVYVDQWDWEKVISPAQRNYETLIKTVKTIYATIRSTEAHLTSNHDSLEPFLPEEIVFVPSDQLQQRYPDCTPQEREDKICAEYGAVFIAGIGAKLADGMPHDGRAPDYDDWTTPRSEGGRGLNGDIVVWHPVLEKAFELSSMGIRVDAECLRLQLEESGDRERSKLPFHEELLAGKLPQTMGGGIGQSRLCMLLLRTAHIGEVAVGVWPQRMKRACSEAGIFLL